MCLDQGAAVNFTNLAFGICRIASAVKSSAGDHNEEELKRSMRSLVSYLIAVCILKTHWVLGEVHLLKHAESYYANNFPSPRECLVTGRVRPTNDPPVGQFGVSISILV